MRITIDRIEEEFAVVELPDGSIIDNIPRKLFPGAAEGDIIDIIINEQETANKRVSIQSRFDRLIKKSE